MNTTFTTYAEKKAKQFLNLLQGYSKGIRMTAILILLLMGVNNAWGAHKGSNSGFWDNEGLKITFEINGTLSEKTLNYASPQTTSLGTITTSLKMTKTVVNFWTNWGHEAKSSIVYWELYKSNTKIGSTQERKKTGNEGYNGSNSTNTETTVSDILASTTGPGDYSIRVHAKFESSEGTYWYNRNITNGYYTFTFTINPVVTFKANGGTGSDYTQTVKYNTNTALAANNFTRTNYTFAGWNTKADGSGTSYTDKQTVKITANTTLYAKWTLSEQQFNVTAVASPAEGGKVTPTSATQMGQTSGGTITATANTGYTFNNWTIKSGSGYFGASGTNTTSTTAETKFRPKATSTVQANFIANKYTVKFHENGGTGSMADQEFTYDVEQALTGNAFTLENALFVGWATSENGTVTYTDGQSVSNLTTTKDGVVNLYAVWATIEITKHDEYISPNDHLKLSFTYSNIPSGYYYRVKVNAGYYQNSSQVEWITISGSGTEEFTSHLTNLPQQANTVLIELCDGNRTKMLESNSVIVTAERFWEVAVYKKVNNIETHVRNISPTEHIGVEITAENIAGYQFTGWSANTPHITIDNQYSTTTIIKAAAGGIVYANYKELEDKTIYLKTVEGDEDGYKWFIKYGGQEYPMDELGCTNEYYKGVVPEGTSFQFVSKDNNNATVETKGTDLQYVEGKTLYNLVSLAAGGTKIFFKPNQQWIDTASNNNYYFAGHFWTGSHVWKQMTDDNRDGIYDCEKPTNGNEVIFCLVKTTNNIENWENDWSHTIIQTDGNNAYKQIPNGSNLFTITDNKEKNNAGTWSTHADTPVNGEGEWTTFTGITYRITFNQQGATTAGTTHVDVAYHASMPEIEKLPAKNEKKFGGYYTQEDGQGVMLVNAFGEWQDANGYISSTTWEREECVTLYAYWKELTPEITDVTLSAEIFEPIDENQEGFVTAKPIINEHNNTTLTYVVCWKLLYTNGREVEGHNASTEGCEQNQVKFSIAGLSTGTYTIRASMHTGNDCGSGEEISRFDKQFSIVANRIITVNYTCDGNTIMASTKQNAHVIDPTSITAPNIVGYTFKEWVAGDGVEIKTTSGDGKTITYTATYNGTITAKYTKKKLIYLDLSQKFSESGKWSDPYIYLYGSNGYWDNEKGAGATGDACKAKGAMTKIEGTDIWYYDYSNVAGFTKYLAFTWGDSRGKANFDFGDVIYRGDFSEGTPLFVPATDQTKEDKNGAKYYSKGYWVNYIGEHTGYTLIIYNEAGDKELIRQKFTSANKRMNMTSVIDLEAEHKYQYEVLRDHGYYYKYNSSQLTNTNRGPKPLNTADKGTIITTAAGDYTFTLGYKSGDLQISVDYPAAVGDYRILYRDNGTTNWSGNPRPQNWCHPSRIIKKKEGAIDTISFFINKDKEPQLLYQTIKSIDANTGAITWNAAQEIKDVKWNVIEKDGVINFTFTQSKDAIAVTNIELYKGNYYIRVDAVDGQWGHYKTNADNRMTYSAFSESDANSFGEKFSHYKTKWCPRGTNVKFTIANDYSPCITDTLIRDVTKTWEENMDEHGKLKSDGSQDPTADKYSANIRFMWNRKDNKISRAYLSSATNVTKKFLILQGDDKMKNAEGKEIAATEHVPADATLLDDKQNWIYETTIKVQPGARVKLYACYATPAGENDIATAQYFRGTNEEFSNASTVQILGGTGETWNTMRVIYDFKTNRLMGAWVPDTEIGDNGLQIDADIMIMREHQEEATCINLTENANSKLTDVKTVYGVMRFNRWILNNRANPKDLDVDHCSTFNGNDRNYDEEKVKEYHSVLPLIEQKSIYERSLYFISFPFDVNLSDVFGFGTYWNEWYIEYYDGLKRAREGFFIDSPPNWKYVTPEMADTFKLRAYQGYILGLDLDYMQYNNTSFWTHNMQEVELFFPSTTTMGEIAKEEVTMPALGPEYECKINRPNSDHRVIDSYWRCIGVPSYANYDGLLYAGKNGSEITWKTDRTWTGNYTEFPFLYSWNTTDNTITPRSTREFKFKAMHSYLVQNKSQIYWKAVNVNVTPSPAAIMAREMEETRREYEWRITLTKGEKEQDQTFVRLTNHEQVTTEFDFNQDLSKEFNYGRSDIYTLIGYEKAAANSLPLSEQTTLIPLGLSIEYNGDYTIAMPDGTANIGVTLIDTESNTRTNLSAGMEYTLTLNKGDYNNRFFIEISPIQQTPTDIEYVTGDSNSQNSVRKVLIDNILYIVRDGQMFDARGARVK